MRTETKKRRLAVDGDCCLLRAVDLCCGAGGWACAASGLPVEFVAVADLAEDCLETWRVNHQAEHPQCRRLRVDLSEPAGVEAVLDAAAGGVDVVLGGIPCEQVSIIRQAPASEQIIDRWHRLLDNCLRIVRDVGARWWSIEDVIQIERHLPLPLFHGSHVPHVRIDASAFGPQSRLRTFLGHFPLPVPPGDCPRRCLADCLQPGPHLTIPDHERYERLRYPGQRITLRTAEMTARVLAPESPSPTVLSSGPHRGKRQRRYWCVEDAAGRLRILSLQEFARIQGFPEDFLFAAAACRAQEMIGGAIPIYVGRAILRAIVAEHTCRLSPALAPGWEE